MDKNYEEIEAKFLNIDVDKIQEKLKEFGAVKIGEFLQKWATFDYPDWRLDKDLSWIRVRDEGNGEISLSFKKRLGAVDRNASSNDEGMQEIQLKIDSFEKATDFFKAIGLVVKHTAEKKRIRWAKEDTEFDIDIYPGLEPMIEIETTSQEKIKTSAEALGLNYEDRKIFSSSQAYALKGIDVGSLVKISFEEGLIKRDN